VIVISCAINFDLFVKCFLYIIPMQLFTNEISKVQTDIPKKDFAIMGALDSVSGIMSSFAVNYVPSASLIVLVQQSAIPITMAISKFTLGAQYTVAQYTGAAIVLSGIALVLSPTFFSTEPAAPGESGQMFWLAMLVLSCVPACLSSVYKEKALGEVDINVIYLNGWVAVFQTAMAIPLCFPSASLTGLSMSEILPNLHGGLLCSLGINTITEAHGTYQVDECSRGPLFVGIYLFFNVVYNLLIVVVLKHGSANILYMCFTIIVPLSNVAFSLKITPGHKPLQTMDVIGLVVIMGGLVVYRFSGALYSFYSSLFEKVSDEEKVIRKEAKRIDKLSQKKQTKMIGLNQLEALNAMVDSRVMTAQRSQLFRSPAQVRGDFLLKLGIPPSPLVSMGPNGRLREMQDHGTSPQIYSQMLSMPKFKSPRATYGRNIGRTAEPAPPAPRAPTGAGATRYGSSEV
jgi:drug/metabolite transporter (DMT)-like permease